MCSEALVSSSDHDRLTAGRRPRSAPGGRLGAGSNHDPRHPLSTIVLTRRADLLHRDCRGSM